MAKLSLCQKWNNMENKGVSKMTKENEITEYQEQAPVVQKQHDGGLLSTMLNNHELVNNMDIEKFKALIELNNSQQERAASIEFNKDFAAMQGELPAITKTKDGHNSKYAPYDEVKKVVQPVMEVYGFRDTYSIEQVENLIKVTAKISHKSGHCEETTVTLPHENSGNKNAVHSVGSSISYGKRYALIAALGVATTDDNDAQTQYMDSEELVLIKKSISKADSISALNKAREEATKNKDRMSKQQQLEIKAEVEKTRASIVRGGGDV